MNTLEREASYFFNTYKRIPLEIDHGDGVYLYSKDGTRYLDMFAGLAVNALGYAHPRVLRAIQEQSRKYIHLSNYYLQDPQIKLAELLIKYSGYSKLFFTNSGTEAIEGAIKISRRWGIKNGKNEIISFSNAFHGRTMGALSLMDRPKYRDGFEPFLENCRVVEFNNIDNLRKAVSHKTVAVVLEFIQGEGGICPATPEFVEALASLKKQFGFLVVADEIQSGLGRTGKFFGFQNFNINPDIVVIAKPLGGGLPLGAILGNEIVADVLDAGSHGTTFGGNSVACAAGIAVMEELMERGVMTNAEKVGRYFKSMLLKLQEEFPAIVREVRGYGLMIGIDLHRNADPIVTAMRERKILINGTADTVLRFLPPLIINEQHIDETVSSLQEIFLSYK